MNYQLILQFDTNSKADSDGLVALETELIESLGEIGVVNGHDFGSGTFNIFIMRNEPKATFTLAHRVILDEAIPNEMRCAYREANGETTLFSGLRRSQSSASSSGG